MLVDGSMAILDGGGAQGGRRRRSRAEMAKQSNHYQMRNRIAKVDIEENPFCIERQLADAAEQIKVNKVSWDSVYCQALHRTNF